MTDDESTVHLRDAGKLLTPTLIPETAYVKACWAAAVTEDQDRRRALLAQPSRTGALVAGGSSFAR